MRFRRQTALALALAYFYVPLFMSMEVGGHILNHSHHAGRPSAPAVGHTAGDASHHATTPTTPDPATAHTSAICTLMCAVATGLPATDSPLNAAPHLSSESLFTPHEADHRPAVFASLYARPPPVSSNI